MSPHHRTVTQVTTRRPPRPGRSGQPEVNEHRNTLTRTGRKSHSKTDRVSRLRKRPEPTRRRRSRPAYRISQHATYRTPSPPRRRTRQTTQRPSHKAPREQTKAVDTPQVLTSNQHQPNHRSKSVPKAHHETHRNRAARHCETSQRHGHGRWKGR